MQRVQGLGQNGQPLPANAFELAARTPGEQRRIYVAKDFYVYQEDFLALAAGASATGSIDIQADSDFVLQKLGYFADIAAAVQTDSTRVVPLVTISLVDTGSGRNLIETPTPIPTIFGTGRLPFILPTPRVFFARSTITLTLVNFDAAAAYNVRLAFIGYKAYPDGMY